MRCMRQWLTLALTFLMIPPGLPLARAQQPSLPAPAAYVPPLGLGAIVIRPQSVIQYPEMPSPELRRMPLEVIEAWGKENLGINPLALAELKIVFGMPTGPQPPPLGFVFTFIDDFDPANISPELLAADAPQTSNGRKLYPLATPPDGPALVLEMIDSKSGLIADPLMLEAMHNAAEGIGPLADLLKQNPIGTANVQAVVAIQPLRPILAQLVQNPPPHLPAEVAELVKNIVLINSLVSRTKFENGQMISRFEILADDEAGAEKLFRAAEQAIEYGRTQLMAELGQVTEEMEPGPVADATANYLQRMAEEFISSLRPTLRNDRLVVDIQAPVSVAGTGFLIGLLLPAVQASREAARRMQSSNNLKQIALAMHNYHDAYGTLPKAAITSPDGEPLLSWRVSLLPFLDQGQLYDQFRLDEPWDSPHNAALIQQMPALYASAGQPLKPGHTTYHAATGERMLFPPDHEIKFADVTDGLSNTLMVLEGNAASQVPWTSPEYLEIDDNDPLANFRGARPGGFHAAIGDGSVRFLADMIDWEVFKALLTRDGQEQVLLR